MVSKSYFQTLLILVGLSFSACEEHVCSCQFNVNEIAMGRLSELEHKFTDLQKELSTNMADLMQKLQATAEGQHTEVNRIMQMFTTTSTMTKMHMEKYFMDLSNSTSTALNVATEGLMRQAENVTAFMEGQEKKVEALREKIEELEDKEDEQEAEEQAESHGVAFFGTHPVGNPPSFSTVVTNIGDGYNERSGEFVCPVAGIYLFTFSVQTIKYKNVHCNIMKNGKKITYAQTSNQYADTSSISAVIALSIGDSVRLGSCQNLNSAFDEEGTTFAGVLIHQQRGDRGDN